MLRAQSILASLVSFSLTLASVSPAFAQDPPPPSQPPPGYAPPPPPAGYEPPPGNYAPPGARPRPRARGSAGSAEVRFEPDDPNLQLLSMSGGVPVERFHAYRGYWGWHGHYSYGWAPMYSPVCDGACATRFEPGAYQLALAKDGGRPIPVYGSTMITGPARLRGSYTDKSGVRAAGWIIGIGGLVGGIVMIAASAHDHRDCDPDGFDCRDHETLDAGLFVGGIGVLVATGIVGGILASQRDRAHLTLEPLRLSSYGRMRETEAALGAYSNPEGATLSLHF